MVACPEDPLALCGKPIGMYHCPYCGCMQVACVEHLCDPDACMLEACDCLPEGVLESPNLRAWKERYGPKPLEADQPGPE